MNSNIDIDNTSYGSVNNRYKKHMCEAHERIINSAKLDEYEQLDMPNPPRLIRTHLPDSANINNPRSFFDLFVKGDDFDDIVMNTNKYTE